MSKEESELNEIWKAFQDEIKDQPIDNKHTKTTNVNDNIKTEEFPTRLSIITAMDELIECYAIGGQVRNYYRYGAYDDCKRQREKFWFSLKYGTLQDKENPLNTSKIQEFYKERFLQDRSRGGSSEDIWDLRRELLDDPFNKH
ncbi:unnamed protein product [Candida verbasci]|uniref:Early meiotic induction protein 1 n=1 Tax=Candida verbasci TaxID=1227364 RepID=A0A9W4TRS4_9ASCO|nr:unnamed protein product [Candida verbasci]